jgi:cytochrome c oxidase subunit 2
MRNLRLRPICGCAALLLVLLAGCGGSKGTVDVAAAPERKVTVEMKASNYAFDPGTIIGRKGETLVLRITNVSGERHNLTVKDPAGKIVRSEDLPGHQTVTMEIPLDTAGVYPFYCDIDLHATLGMKGRIDVK